MDQHELSIAKIILDHPNQLERFSALGLNSSKVSSESFLWRLLRSYEELRQDKVKPNRSNLISFMEIIDEDERELIQDQISESDVSGGSLENAEAHIQAVMRSWKEGELRLILNQSAKILNKEGSEQSLEFLQRGITSLYSGGSVRYKNLPNFIEEHEEFVNKRPEGVAEYHDLFGLPSLNKVRGHDPGTGEVIYIVGGAKSGKSSAFNTIIKNFIEKNEPLFAGSGEMQSRKTGERALAADMKVSSRMVGSRMLIDDEYINNLYKKSKIKFSGRDKIFIDFVDLSVDEARAIVYYYYHNHGIRIFLFDRIELFKEVREGRDEFRGLRQVSSALRTLANELEGVKLIVAAQLNQNYAKRSGARPRKGDAFGGTALEAACTQMIFIYNPMSFDPTETEFRAGPWEGHSTRSTCGRYWFVEIYVVFNTNGPQGVSCLVAFDPSKQVFLDAGDKVQNFTEDVGFDSEIERIKQGSNTYDPTGSPPAPLPTSIDNEVGVKGDASWDDDLPF